MRRLGRFTAAVVCSAVAMVLGGCTGKGGSPVPSPTSTAATPGTTRTDTPELAAAALATALAKKDVTGVQFVGAEDPKVNDQLTELVRGMGPLSPTVTAGAVDSRSNQASALLTYRWSFPGIADQWTYDVTAALQQQGGRWETKWQPSLVHPDLTTTSRLSQRRVQPERGAILGAEGEALVRARAVVRYGLDKAHLPKKFQQSSARKLATLLDIDVAAYLSKVKGAGDEAFVEAITLRANDPARPANKTVFAIAGALPIEGEQSLAPTRDFARALLGHVGDASKEIVDASKGAVVAGDQVGLSGLQRRYDERLRGTPGVEVRMVPATTATPSATPTASPSASSAPTRTVFSVQPRVGKKLSLTLSLHHQRVAEKVLARTKPAAALVALRPSTGEVLAAANGPGAKGQPVATTGQFAPGSTFKVATSLALLRAGVTPGSTIRCPTTVTVDGRKFVNYSDYPRSTLGTITLETAVAQSCNTAFIGQRGKVGGEELAQAAGSLGLGVDYDVGFPSFFGSVPPETSATGRAAALIGQAKVQASPLAMASVAASVAAGRTVVPQLLSDVKPVSTAKPLTTTEAAQLRQLLGAVVDEGSGRLLQPLEPPQVMAKTGTAEYGSEEPLRTHAWMIAAQGDLAVAVFVGRGASGSKTAGPLLKKYLQAVR